MSSFEGSDDDELDRLTRLYESQAHEEAAKAKVAAQPPAKRRKREGGGGGAAAQAKLSEPLPPENKGFQLLARMGYAPGNTIGKSGTGLKEPVAVELKQNKLGLGAVSKKALQREARAHTEQKEAAQRELQAQNAEISLELQREDFRERVAQQAALRLVKGDFTRAIAACRTLDDSKGLETNHEWALEESIENETGEEGGEAVPLKKPEERLNEVLDYLRSRHCFCLYCGVEYESAEDMAENCPGPSREEH